MRTFVLILVGLLATITPSSVRAQVPDHPRLTVIDQDLHALTHPSGSWETWTEREQASVLAYRSIIKAADYLVRYSIGNVAWRINFVEHQTAFYHNIKTLAMAHLIRRNEPYDNSYLDYACGTLDLIRTSGYPMWYSWADPYNTDMNTGEMLAGWALAFDWLYQDMTAEQINNSIEALYHLLENQDYDLVQTGLNDNNHISVCFGGRGLACLALETHLTPQQEVIRRIWLSEARDRVIDYFDWGFGSDGAGFEGVFYSMYGLNTALPFGLATDRLDHLAPHHRVDVKQRHVQQAGTWLCYEQLPFDPAAGTPINDTDRPRWDLNNTPFKPYPWLMAFGTPDRPSGAKLLFLTQYPPADWGSYLEKSFDPDSPDARACFFSRIRRPDGDYVTKTNHSAVDVLLGWPEESTPPEAFYEYLRPSRAFTGRGIVYFREEAHSLDDGSLASDPNGWFLTFESQEPPGWTPGGHQGHRQNDTNHYLYYWNKHAIAYDSGHRSWSASYHNARMIREPGQSWMEPRLERGSLVRQLVGSGSAPSFAIGNDAAGWNWDTDIVDRSHRSFLVIPRSAGAPPFVVIYDDLDFFAGNTWESRFYWQTAEEATMTAVGNSRARSVMSETAADMSFLQPVPSHPLTVELIEPWHDNWPPHPRLTAQFGASENPNVIALLEAYLTSEGPALSATPILHSNPRTYAYEIDDGADYYIVVLREADAAGVATFNVHGKTLTTDALHTVLHFSSGGRAWSDISAGLMVEGTRVWYDNQYVIGIYNDSLAGDLTFDAVEVSVAFDEGGATSPAYYVGPVIPTWAVVDGEEQTTDMIDLPHPLASSFPNRVCRSPNNDTALPEYQYTVNVYLRTAEGSPVVGWPVEKISMDIQNCPNPRLDLLAEGPSDAEGKMVWIEGLDSGGSHQVAGGSVVLLNLDYEEDGVRRVHSYDSVTSPDEDGDMDVDEDDFVIWNEAFQNEEPLYIGDLNRDDVISWDDYYWLQGHGLPGYHRPPPPAIELNASNPARREAEFICGLAVGGPAKVDVFDVQGRLVRNLVEQHMTRGTHTYNWDGRDNDGVRMGSGVYFLRFQQGDLVRVARVVLLH